MKTAKKPIKADITGTGGNTFPISVITGIIRGHFSITNLPLVKRWTMAVESKEARAIVVYLPKRHPKFPNIPTQEEACVRS